MAGEDDVGEDAETAPGAERPASAAFGRRRSAAPSPGKLAQVSATTAAAEGAFRNAAGLKPRGLSWGLVLCLAAIVVLGVLALINRPQIDDEAAYYVAAGVLIYCAIIADRRGWLRIGTRPLLVAFVAAFAFVGLINLYWLGSYAYWHVRAPIFSPVDPNAEDLLSFHHPWCSRWSDLRHTCFRPPSTVEVDAVGFETSSKGSVTCFRSRKHDQPSRRFIVCEEAQVPTWCTQWWSGSEILSNPSPKKTGGEARLVEAREWPTPSAKNAIGQCLKTMWGF